MSFFHYSLGKCLVKCAGDPWWDSNRTWWDWFNGGKVKPIDQYRGAAVSQKPVAPPGQSMADAAFAQANKVQQAKVDAAIAGQQAAARVGTGADVAEAAFSYASSLGTPKALSMASDLYNKVTGAYSAYANRNPITAFFVKSPLSKNTNLAAKALNTSTGWRSKFNMYSQPKTVDPNSFGAQTNAALQSISSK